MLATETPSAHKGGLVTRFEDAQKNPGEEGQPAKMPTPEALELRAWRTPDSEEETRRPSDPVQGKPKPPGFHQDQ